MQEWLKIVLTVICALSSSVVSGLILGYMSLDLTQLQSLAFADPKSHLERVNQRRAKVIYPIRKDPNLLLSTLIFTNSMVNAAMVLFLGDLLDVTWGFILSTVITALFGEILPQLIFVKHSLTLCWLFSRLVTVLLILLYPITKPLSLLLNVLIGSASQEFYTKQQLKAFVDVQYNCGQSLTMQEAKMLKGCLECSSVCAEMIMTPMEDVFSIRAGSVVDRQVLDYVAKSGFSKVPVVDGTREQCVVGMLLAKDLLLLKDVQSVEISHLLDAIGKPTFAVDASCGILELINHFKMDSTHVVVVRKAIEKPSQDGSSTGDPIYAHVGIVTMDDVVEVIIQESLEDVTERGLKHKDLMLKRSQTTSEKWQRLASLTKTNPAPLPSTTTISQKGDNADTSDSSPRSNKREPTRDEAAIVATLLNIEPNEQEIARLVPTSKVNVLEPNTQISINGTIALVKGTLVKSTKTPGQTGDVETHLEGPILVNIANSCDGTSSDRREEYEDTPTILKALTECSIIHLKGGDESIVHTNESLDAG